MIGRSSVLVAMTTGVAVAAAALAAVGMLGDAAAETGPTGAVVFHVSDEPGDGYRSVSVVSGEVTGVRAGIEVAVACSPDLLSTSTDASENTAICTVNLESGRRLLVADAGVPVQHPTPSPDGDRIVFASGAEADRGLKVVSAHGGEVASLCRGFCPLFRFSDIAWSPDGSRVAFVATTPGSGGHLPQIYTVTVGDDDYTQLTATRGIESDPAWSPDGSQIAFASSRSGDTELWLMNSDGSGQRQLTDRAGRDLMPTWSPDGRWLAFTRHIDRSWDLAIIDVDGGATRALTRLEASASRPVWVDQALSGTGVDASR